LQPTWRTFQFSGQQPKQRRIFWSRREKAACVCLGGKVKNDVMRWEGSLKPDMEKMLCPLMALNWVSSNGVSSSQLIWRELSILEDFLIKFINHAAPRRIF